MSLKHLFTMSPEQHAKLLEAMQPVPYMVVGGHPLRSRQESANAAWEALGKELGFKFMTVTPNRADPSQLTFYAEPIEAPP